ncbi:Copia protein, partial [Mucuna pruriens]
MKLNLCSLNTRLDRGGEYITNSLQGFCEKNDIIHEFTTPNTPQQNGIAKRKIRTLKDMMNVIIINSTICGGKLY